MDIFNIQNLINEGKIVSLADIDPTKAYLQLGVFQNGNREKGAGNANTYESYAIPISELIPGGGGGGCEVRIITAAEAQILVSSDGIVPCDIYVITGVDINLYGGTTIILRGEDTNHFTAEGYGLFYNPKYDPNELSYGIYSPFSTFTISADPFVPFTPGENIQGDNGATAIMLGSAFAGMTAYMFITGGDWTTATTVTGQSSGSVANLSSATPVVYNSGDQVIWGGKLWTSITGVSSFYLDQFNLNPTDWVEVPFNINDYNVVLDPIIFDQTGGIIIGRTEVAVGNKVTTTAVAMAITNGSNPIRGFQWGNPFTVGSGPIGVGGNIVDRSYFENINWSTKYCYGNTLEDESIIQDVITINRPGFQGNNLKSASKIISGAMINSNIRVCEFYQTNFINNSFQGVQSSDSQQFYSVHLNETTFSSNYILEGEFSSIYFKDSSILNNQWVRTRFVSCEFSDSSFQVNGLVDSTYSDNNHYENSVITYNQFVSFITFQYNTLIHTQFSQNLIANSAVLIENEWESSNISTNQFINESFFSYNDVDSTGVSNNVFDQSTAFYQNIFQDCVIFDNHLTTSQIYANVFLTQSSLVNCVGHQYQMFNNYLAESSSITVYNLGDITTLHTNRFTQASSFNEVNVSTTRVVFSYNTLSNQSTVTQNTYIGVADIQFTGNSLDNQARISENTIESATIINNYLNGGSQIHSNQLLNFSTIIANHLYQNSRIEGCNLAGGQIENNHLEDSYIAVYGLENTYITYNRLTNGSFIQEGFSGNTIVNVNDNTLDKSSINDNNWVLNGGINNNRLYNQSRINDNILDDGVIFENTISDSSSIYHNNFNGQVSGNVLTNECQIVDNVILIGSLIKDNILTRDSRIDNNVLQNSYISSNILEINSTIFQSQFYFAAIFYNRMSSSEMQIFAQDPTVTNQSEIAYNDLSQSAKILEIHAANQVVNILHNTLISVGSIQNNIWTGDGEISYNFISQDSGIIGNTFNSGLITHNTLQSQSLIVDCILSDGSVIAYSRFQRSNINAMSLTTNSFNVTNYDLINSYLDSWTVVSGSTVSNNVTFTNITVTGATLLPNPFSIYEFLPEFANNAAALLGNLTFGARYRITGTGSVQIVI